MFLVPDLSTWADHAVGDRTKRAQHERSAGCTTPNGELFEGDPRMVLARAMDYAAAWATSSTQALSWSSSCSRTRIGDISRRDARCRRLLRPDRRPGRRRPQGYGERAGGDGHQGRDVAPRGGEGAARDRLRVRRTPCHRRQRGDIQVYAQGDRRRARAALHVHAQADLRDQRLGHAHAPEPRGHGGRARQPASPTTTTGTASRRSPSSTSPAS